MRLGTIIIYLFITLAKIFGLSDRSLEFSVEYFVGVETKYVCLMSCEKSYWYRNFVKRGSSQNIAAMSVYVDRRENVDFKMIDLCLSHSTAPIGILINPKCSTFEDLMYYASENSFFDARYKWLIVDETEIINNLSVTVNTDRYLENFNSAEEENNVTDINMTIVQVLSAVNLSVDADITVSITKDSRRYEIFEIFNFGKIRGGKFIIQKIGNWDEKKGLNISKVFKYYRRWDFQRMALKMIVAMNTLGKAFDPVMITNRVPAPGVAVITQTGTQVLEEVAALHNIRYNYTVVDRWVGDYKREHLYTVTNGLYFREHDITPVLRFLRNHFSRYDVLFPSVTLYETRYYYKIPSYGIGNFENQFLRPLSTTAWWCVVAIAILCGIVLMLSAIVERRPITIDFALFSVLALICQQFFEEFEDVRRISSARKLTILVTGLSCLLIYNYYTSSVVSWLLNGPPPSINSLQELLESPLQPVFQDTGVSYSWLQADAAILTIYLVLNYKNEIVFYKSFMSLAWIYILLRFTTRYYYKIPSYGIGNFENQFLRPLSTAAWWCVVAIAILCGIVLMLSAIVERRPITIDFALFSVLALICQQFFEEFEDVRRISSARKLTILVTGLSCLLIYNYYTSSVVSWLLNGPPPSINSLQELLESPLQPVFQYTGVSYSWLQLPDYYYNNKNTKAEDELKKRLLNMKKNGKNIFKSVNDGIDLVRQGGYVYHTDTNGANKRISETFTQRELCDLDSLESMPKYLLYPCVQKNSPYRQFYSWSLLRLKERGIIRCIQLRTWSQGLKCDGSSPRALALGGAAPAFILLAIGYVLGTIIMLLERLKWKHERARLKCIQRATLST